jgi:hypothetical protein
MILSAYAQEQPGEVLLAVRGNSPETCDLENVLSVSRDPSTANIQQIVNSSGEHSAFIFKAGVYRGLSLARKTGDVFIGLRGAILNGSEVLTFKSVNERLWQAKPATEAAGVVNAGILCENGLKNADGSPYTIGCTHSRSLYWDDHPLWRVATLGEVAAQKWYFDDAL